MVENHNGYTMYEDGASPWMRDMARDILGILDVAYPGHPWAATVYGDERGGGYFIRHLDFPANWGMNQPFAHMFASTSELRADVIRKGGELLERSNLARRRWNEESIKRMEGVPEKWQPEPDPEKISRVNMEKYIAVGKSAVREVMPQVKEMIE
jgi:hypothetical protein